MARIRTVKPELFKHEELFDLEKSSGLPIRISFIGLFACSDREGRFKWRPRALKLDIAPYDEFDFEAALVALQGGGFIEKYESEGEMYGWIPTFLKHQAVNLREAKSALPDPAYCVAMHAHETHVHARAGETEVREDEYQGMNVAPALIETILARDGCQCRRCGGKTDLVDLIFPRSIGGTHVPANLRALCQACNSARPVAGQALIDDLAKDSLTLDDMQRMCMHVYAHGEGKGREGKGKEGEKEGKEISVDRRNAPLDHDPVPDIFGYWQKTMKSPKSKMDKKRVDQIRKALKTGYTPRQLCEAIKGCSRSDFHMARGKYAGENKQNGINLILRDAEHIDKFIAIANMAVVGAESIEERNERIIAEFVNGPTAPASGGMGDDDDNTIEMEE